MSHKVFPALILSLILAAAAGPAAAAPITWTGASFNNSWHNPGNWDLNRVPGAGDDVVIPDVADPVCTFSSGTTTINRLDCNETFNINGGSLTITGSPSSIDGSFTMFGGSLTVGGTLEITSSVGWTGGTLATTGLGTLRFTGSDSRTFGVGPILDSEGNVEFTNGTTTIGPGTTLDITGLLSVNAPAVVTINQDATIGQLLLNSGTLDGSGSLMLTNGFTWRSGTMGGGGATTISPTAVMNINSDIGSPNLARHLYNENLINHFGPISVTISSGGVIKNRSGGIIQFLGTAGFGGSSGVVANQAGGLIDKAVHAGTVLVGTPVTNDLGAEIRVTSGTLHFNANVTNEGLIHSLPGTHLIFAGGSNTFNAGSTLDVDNDVAFTIGTSTIHPGAVVSVADSLRLVNTGILSGVVSLETNISVPFFGLRAGTLQGSGTLTVTSGLLWNGGMMTGAGSTILAPGSVNTIDTSIQTGNIRLDRLLVNQGTCFYDGTYTMTIQAAGIMRNASGGTFNIPVESDIVSGGLFDNQAGGLLFKYGGSGESGLTGTFTNNGTVRVTTGTFRLVNGTFTNFSSGTLTGGTYDLSTRFKFDGANIVTNAANIILSGTSSEIVNESDGNALSGLAANAATGTLTIKNGRVLTVTPAFTNAGYLGLGEGGTGQLIANAGFNQTAGTTVLQNGTLTSAGLVHIQGGSLTGYGTVGGTLQNDAVLSAGFSPGAITVLGSFLQTGGGQFVAEIGGTTSGSTYDNLSVSGNASLGGHLQVSLINGFVPTAGQTFNVITASSRSGAFGSDNLPIAAGAACLEVGYLSGGVAIQALEGTSIQTHPQDQTACPGSPVTFSTTITGGPASFQWRKNAVAIGGANASSFTISSVAPGDSGTYDVVVTGACGAVTSDPAVLTVECQSGVDDVEAASRPGVGYPVPNPSRGALRMGFSLAGTSRVTVDVIDVTGRRVASLVDSQDLPAGDHEIAWNGMTIGGRHAASGLYFLRVVADGRVVTRKVLVQR